MEKKKKGRFPAIQSPEASILEALKPQQQSVEAEAVEAAPQQPIDNTLLQLLRKRQKDADDEATATAIASGLGAMFSGDASGPITEFGMSQMQDRTKRKEKLMDDESNILLAQMRAQAKAKNGSSGKEWQQSKFEMQNKKTGEITSIVGKFNQRTGEYTDLMGRPLDTENFNVSPAYKFDLRKDPRTEELARFGQRGGGVSVATQGFERGKELTEKQKNIMRATRDKLNQEPQYKNAKGGVAAAQKAVEMLMSDNPIGDASVLTIFPRMFGEVGNLAYQEQARFAGNPMLMASWERMKEKYLKTGKLPEEDRRDLLEIASIMAEYDRKRVQDIIGQYGGSESMLGDIDRGQMMEYLGSFAMPEVKGGSIAEKGAARAKKLPSAPKPRRVIQGGWIYELDGKGNAKPIGRAR